MWAYGNGSDDSIPCLEVVIYLARMFPGALRERKLVRFQASSTAFRVISVSPPLIRDETEEIVTVLRNSHHVVAEFRWRPLQWKWKGNKPWGTWKGLTISSDSIQRPNAVHPSGYGFASPISPVSETCKPWSFRPAWFRCHQSRTWSL